ncbi:hypothetical protein [Paenibacillus sp. NPDC057934]|uniref:hypothetical protein n=1 Tax=Paenibacillus sp. NPDC057934 TaxID=3346282 RepID=UPI0036D77F0B
MKSNIFKSKILILLLSISVILGNFPIDISSAQGLVTNEEATPVKIHPRETSYPEPIPTIAPTESNNREDSFNKSPISPVQTRELSSSKSSLLDAQDVRVNSAPALKIMEDSSIRIFSEQYAAHFGEKEPVLSKDQVKELFSMGAEYIDIYAISLLQDLYQIQPKELLTRKQANNLS